MFVNHCCFYVSAIKRQLVICIFKGEISVFLFLFCFVFLPKRRKLLVTFWEITAEKLRNKCNLLFTYPHPNHSSLTQHMVRPYRLSITQWCHFEVGGVFNIRVFIEKIDTPIQWIIYDSPRLNPHILQCAMSKMYQENTHITWNTHTVWKCDFQKQKWGKQSVGRSHCKVIEPQFLKTQVCQKQRKLT